MFVKNTLFILGAGASVPYGFPLGKALISDIITDMDDVIYIPRYKHNERCAFVDIPEQKSITYSVDKIINDCKALYVGVEKINEQKLQISIEIPGCYDYTHRGSQPAKCFRLFPVQIKQLDKFMELRNALINFDPVSIDAFIRDNPSHAMSGKTMIYYSLLKRENKSKHELLMHKKNNKETKSSTNISNEDVCPQDNWLIHLLNDLTVGCSDNPESLNGNNVKFITFNYENSLEYFLYSRLYNIETFRDDDGGASIVDKFFEKTDVHHVYGSLRVPQKDLIGEYGNYFTISGLSGLESKCSDTRRFIFSINEFTNIKTMFDERKDGVDKDKVKHKEYIEWSNEIIIIGFGFDRDNLNILGFPNKMQGYRNLFEGKAVRYLDYDGNMNSLAQEFELIDTYFKSISTADNAKKFHYTRSVDKSISFAYQNDFKKSLFS